MPDAGKMVIQYFVQLMDGMMIVLNDIRSMTLMKDIVLCTCSQLGCARQVVYTVQKRGSKASKV